MSGLGLVAGQQGLGIAHQIHFGTKATEGLRQLASDWTASDDDDFLGPLGEREHALVRQVRAGLQPVDARNQRARPGRDHRLLEPQLRAVHLDRVRRGETRVAEIHLRAGLLHCLDRVARAAHGPHPANPLHDGAEVDPGRTIEPKAEIAPAAGVVNSARAANERLARRAPEIDAGSAGQPLLRHGDATPELPRGDG